LKPVPQLQAANRLLFTLLFLRRDFRLPEALLSEVCQASLLFLLWRTLDKPDRPGQRSNQLSSEGAAMANGTVKWFNDAKGFGFIEPQGGGADVFAHFSAVQMEGFRTLRQGGFVSYELVQGPKGDLAQNICALDSQAIAEADHEVGKATERASA